MFPLINYRSTSIRRAFILNSIAIAIIAVVTVEIKGKLDDTKYKKGVQVLITFSSSFLVGLFTYTIMWAIFGFGGGMLVQLS